ncbi:MAG: hypothetical protein KF850_00275 [Labilithrix sp.]|nr:hypothetical protein [Labilithrix sp.]
MTRRTQAEPVTSPLRVSPVLSGASAASYAHTVRALVRRYALETKLVRLTLNAQPAAFA